jgi:hypothetical protein
MRMPVMAALAAALFAAPALAQNATPSGDLPKAPYFRAGPEHMLEVYPRDVVTRIFSNDFTNQRRDKVMSTITGAPGVKCPERPNVVVYAMIPFNLKNGKTTWIERYAVGCEKPAGRNLMAILDGGNLQLLELVRGETRTDPFLQRDLNPVVSGIAKSRAAPDCQRYIVADTKITQQPQGAGGWVERWDLAVCAATHAIEITFTPSAQGGTTWNIKQL